MFFLLPHVFHSDNYVATVQEPRHSFYDVVKKPCHPF